MKLTLTLLILSITLSVKATIFYVDATNGNDNYAGTSPSLAWKTLTKVNSYAWNVGAGDSILFKCNEVWNGMLTINGSGNSLHPLVYASYGLGNKPLINGNGNNRAAIWVQGAHCSYITIKGFAVTNFDGLNVYDSVEADRSGIYIGNWQSVNNHIRVTNNEAYFVEGFSNSSINSTLSPRGTTLDPANNYYWECAGILYRGDTINSYTVDSNYVHDCTTIGISMTGWGYAADVLVEHNSVYNVGCDGIVIGRSPNLLVQYNSCINAGNNSGTSPRGPNVLGYAGIAVAGMWSYNSTNPVFQYNYCEGTRKIMYDGQPWDFDINEVGGVYQYNYSRDNEGGFNLSDPIDTTGVFRYNISYNDGAKQGIDGEGFFNGRPAAYNNNVFYRDDTAGFAIFDLYWSGNAQYPIGHRDFINNIFYSTSTTNITYDAGPTGASFSHNCFYGHTPINPGVASLNSDPKFSGNLLVPGKILPGAIFSLTDLQNAVNGFQLLPASPCINTGLNLLNNGGIDFWGNTLYTGSTSDIGAYEQPVTTSSYTNLKTNEFANLFPNPSNGVFTLQLSKQSKSPIEVTVFNLIGEQIYKSIHNNLTSSIDLSNEPNGVYYIHVVENNEPVLNQKIIVSK